MGLRVPWQDQYLICQSSTISEAKDFSAGSIGIEADKYVLPLTDHPHLSSGQNIADVEKALGISYRVAKSNYEYFAGTRLPVVTLNCDYTVEIMGLLGYLFFQRGAIQDVAPTYEKTYSAWDDATPEVYCNIAKPMSASTGDGFRIRGGICRSITVSGGGGEAVKVSAEIVGAHHDNDFNAGNAVFNWSEHSPVMIWDSSSVQMQLGSDPVKSITNDLDEFSLTINNNCVPKFYNKQTVQSFVLGKLTGTVSFRFNWRHADVGGKEAFEVFKSGAHIYFYLAVWASAFSIDGIVKSAELVNEEQAKIAVGFDIAAKGINNVPITVCLADSVDRGIT